MALRQANAISVGQLPAACWLAEATLAIWDKSMPLPLSTMLPHKRILDTHGYWRSCCGQWGQAGKQKHKHQHKTQTVQHQHKRQTETETAAVVGAEAEAEAEREQRNWNSGNAFGLVYACPSPCATCKLVKWRAILFNFNFNFEL